MAVSVCDHFPSYFEGACHLAVNLFEDALKLKGEKVVLSINTPNIPACDIKGVRVARLGSMIYDEWFESLEPEKVAEMDWTDENDNGETSMLYQYSGSPAYQEDQEEDIDIRLISEGYATVSMVKYDLNDYEGLEKIKTWEIGL